VGARSQQVTRSALVRDPEVEQPARVDEGDAAGLGVARLGSRRRREPAERHEDAYVAAAEDRHEGAQADHVRSARGLALNLDLDAGVLGSERVAEGDDVDARKRTTFSKRRNPFA
jgi:hypothetical protein